MTRTIVCQSPPRITLPRLQPGMLVRFDGEPFRVLMVNDCRALIQALRGRVREYTPATGKNAGKVVRYEELPRQCSISPESELEIISMAMCEEEGPR